MLPVGPPPRPALVGDARAPDRDIVGARPVRLLRDAPTALFCSDLTESAGAVARAVQQVVLAAVVLRRPGPDAGSTAYDVPSHAARGRRREVAPAGPPVVLPEPAGRGARGVHRAPVRGGRRGGCALLPSRLAQEPPHLGRGPGAVPALAEHERRWLCPLADGTTVAALARRVGYVEREMHRLLAAFYRRLGASTRTEALLAAQRPDLLSEPTA